MHQYRFVSFLLACYVGACFSWGENYKKVKLQDVQVLTLHQGQMTTGRRSSPVPQLTCVGGSARGLYNPEVVQCYNRGWDGLDVQWECKMDLDQEYRLGSVTVACEGYDYPDDPYILAGSCGLEYSLELTQLGREKRAGGSSSSQHQYSSSHYDSSYYTKGSSDYGSSQWKGLSDLILLGVVCIVIYALYKTCIDSNTIGDRQYSSTNDDGGYPSSSPGAGGWNTGAYGGGTGGGHHGGYADASCGQGAGHQRGTGAGAGAGNFWTGAGVGGLLGYMFGARNNTGYGNYGYNRGYTGWGGTRYGGGGYGGGGYGGGTGFAASGTTSGGTRTASGFGGTRRR